jgi:hypothetical protein
VRPEDTKGSITYCWCGLPFDHDWPGKERGRKHPRGEAMSTAPNTTENRIERRQLRAYDDDLADVIVEAVNGYNARYRFQKNGVVLFPPDGTQGITLHARSSSRQVKSARLWFLRHCVGVGEDGKPVNPMVADPTVLVEDHRKRVDRVREEARAEALETLAEMKQGPQESSLSEPEQPTEQPADDPDEWRPYVHRDGETVNEVFETNGTIYRCKVCKGTPDAYQTTGPRGIGGHVRAKHRDPDTLHGPEARARAVETKRVKRLTRQVEDAVKILNDALGVTDESRQIEALRAENEALRQRAEEAEARLALVQEAFRL